MITPLTRSGDFLQTENEREREGEGHVIDSRKEKKQTPFPKVANIGSIYATSSEHIGGTDGPSILFSTQASFLAAAALSLTFITSILAPAIARKGGEREREGSRILSVKLMSTIYLT